MGQVKPWQVVLIIAAIAAVGVSVYLSFGGDGPVEQASEMTVVDITTGDLYVLRLSKTKAIIMPAPNPETGKRTLFPVAKREDGKWSVSRRDLELLPLAEGEPKALADRKSGHVNVTSETPKKAG
jgi:hypothetical protein